MKKFYATISVLFVLLALLAAAQTSGTQPQTPSSPKAGSAQSAPQGQGPSIDDELQLTADQKQKIAAIVDDEDKQIATVRDDSSLSTPQKMQKAREIHQVAVPKIRAILTPEQLQKLNAIQERKQHEEQNQTPPKQ